MTSEASSPSHDAGPAEVRPDLQARRLAIATAPSAAAAEGDDDEEQQPTASSSSWQQGIVSGWMGSAAEEQQLVQATLSASSQSQADPATAERYEAAAAAAAAAAERYARSEEEGTGWSDQGGEESDDVGNECITEEEVFDEWYASGGMDGGWTAPEAQPDPEPIEDKDDEQREGEATPEPSLTSLTLVEHLHGLMAVCAFVRVMVALRRMQT